MYQDEALCARISDNARQEVRKQYSSESMASQYRDLYERVLL